MGGAVQGGRVGTVVGWGGLVDVSIRARGVPSRAVRPRKPLGQPVVRRSVGVVGGRAGRTSGAVVRGRSGRTVALVTVAGASGVPVGVGAAVVALAA